MILDPDSGFNSNVGCSGPLNSHNHNLHATQTTTNPHMESIKSTTTTTLPSLQSLPFNINAYGRNSQQSHSAAAAAKPNRTKWTLFEPNRIAVATYNFRPNNNNSSSSSSSLGHNLKSRKSSSGTLLSSVQHCLEFFIGDVLVVVEHYGHQWYRGYHESDTTCRLGIFPSSYVQLFDRDLNKPVVMDIYGTEFPCPTLSSYYYTLLDPLFLQVVRTLREWHQHLVDFYRTNTNAEKYQTVRKLMYELVDICSGPFGRELAPSLWRRRCNQILKSTTTAATKDTQFLLDSAIDCDMTATTTTSFGSLANSNNSNNNSTDLSVLEPSLEELYERILSRLNLGNQLLNLEIMPSFTHGTFFNDNSSNYAQLTRRNAQLAQKYWHQQCWRPAQRGKFRPYFARENSKYLPAILDYYNRFHRKFTQRFKQPNNGGNSTSSQCQRVYSSLSFHSPLHSQIPHYHSHHNGNHHNHHHHHHHHHYHHHAHSQPYSTAAAAATSSSSSSVSSELNTKRCRRHLLFSIRDANFDSLFVNMSDQEHWPLLQIDVHILRYNGGNSGGNSTTDSSTNYQVLTEKYCYRIRASSHQQQQQTSGKASSSSSWTSINRALFLDVLSKKPVNGNGSNGSSSHHFSSSSSSSSQQSDATQYYLVIQVWRYGKMLLSESRTKNMLSATMSSASASLSSTGSSVFHTISSSSLSSATAAVAAASTTSLSSLSSFVSNSALFSSSGGGDKSTTSSTPDSSSIDSSELGAAGSFKRSVGFAVIPLVELVSRDHELKTSTELLQDESVISRVLLADDSMLLPVPIKLYEGDLTTSALESLLKYRQSASIGSNALNPFPSSTSSSSNSSSSISKLSLLVNNYQLVVCAKFITESLPIGCGNSINHNVTKPTITTKFAVGGSSIETNNKSLLSSLPQVSVTSLADWLLLSQNATSSTLTRQQVSALKNPSFVLVQKRSFGDLIAGYFRNDLYLTLESADFEKGGKTIPKNVEVAVCLITENGIHERALSSGANDEPVTFYRSHIQYHQNSPKWFEHFKVNVPLELFESAHLRFTFSHCSSKERERKFIGFAFLPLADSNGACLPDGEHELYIYKCENERKLDDVSFYLSVPWGTNEKNTHAQLNSSHSSLVSSSGYSSSSTSLSISSALLNSRSAKESLHIRTNLISSKLTQNSDILSLLKWSCTPLDQVYEALQRISRVSGEEMVKFLEDILDALFALFATSASSVESSSQMSIIFRVLVDFFKTLNEPKFSSYRVALETYIENQFSAPLVHSGLMACVKKYIELVIISFQADTTSPPSLSGVTKRELEFILRCLSVFDWILKIIVQSRILYMQASASGTLFDLTTTTSNSNKPELHSPEDFRTEIFSLFSSINRLLSVETKSSDDYLIIAIQESVLSSLPNAFGYLSRILSPLELSKLVKSIVNSNYRFSSAMNCGDWSPISSVSTTPTNSNQSSLGKRTIMNAKLSLLQETIRCQYVWTNEEARLEMLDTFIRLLNVCIADSRHCLSILQDIMAYLLENSASNCKVHFDYHHHQTTTTAATSSEKHKTAKHQCEREVEMLSFGAIDAIVEHIIELTGMTHTGTTFDLNPSFGSSFKRNNSLSSGVSSNGTAEEEDYLGNYILCFMVLIDFMSLKNYEKLFETRSTRQCKELMTHMFVVFLNALYYFQDNWLEVKMAVNRIILQSLSQLRTIMSQEFLGVDKFDHTIWRTYFKLAIAFITQQRLQINLQLYWKRRFLLDNYGGDMRNFMGFELVTCWNMIGQSKIEFIPSFVPSFVDVTLVPELQLRRATLPILYDMLAVEYAANRNFKGVESALIDKLDAVAHKTECNMQYRQLFVKIMTEQIGTHKPIWYLDGMSLINSVSKLLQLLIDYRNELKCKLISLKHNATEVDNSLLICTYTLLRFFRDEIDSVNSKTIMLRYVDKLAGLHAMLGNYSEAAFTLKLHADQLAWCANEAHKKETIYETMLSYFERGYCWEEGIQLCQDLQLVYAQNFKYAKLSAILKRNAELLDKILNQHRSENEYFRVSFYGLDFPSFLQNRTFIARGLEFEKISNFTHRVQQEFPNAQLLTKNIPSDESITESYSQYIQIFSVKPIAEPPVSMDKSLVFGPPDSVLDYYKTNFVRQFVQDRPIQRAPFDPNNEFKSLWIERTVYTTEKPLPGILRMFEVVATHVNYLSPIENACETIENMNAELSKLIATYSGEPNRPESISPLSMRLQGILDAAVNGGIAKYIEAFLGSEFISSNPDQVENVTLLKNRIANQIKIVESGLTLHGRLAPTPVRPLHTRLLERFATMRNTVHQANIETSQALQWTSPPSQPAAAQYNGPPQNSTPNRPSILSQPLPPIPHFQRQDTSSPETSSLSSSSSGTAICHEKIPPLSRQQTVCTPPLNLPPPPPPSFASPNGKSIKNKPLPPLPPPCEEETATLSLDKPLPLPIVPALIQRHHSVNLQASPSIVGGNLYRSKSKQSLPIDDSIYSVPQLPDIMMYCNEKGSSVDDEDSLDYYDESAQSTPPTTTTTNGHVRHGSMPGRIYRSRSIPRSSISPYNSNNGHTVTHSDENDAPLLHPLQRGQSNQNLNELEDNDFEAAAAAICPPPPLPPRTSTLDRSNSLNSGVRATMMMPPLIPPALPQRRARKLSSNSTTNTTVTNNCNNSSYQRNGSMAVISTSSGCSSVTITSGTNSILSKPTDQMDPSSSSSSSYLTNLDGIEFENLVISSPTPRSESSHQSNRPAPIIGIEINNDDVNGVLPASPLVTEVISNFTESQQQQQSQLLNSSSSSNNIINNNNNKIVLSPSKIQEHRSKSSSLPRMQQFALNFDTLANGTTSTTVVEHIENISTTITSSVVTANRSSVCKPINEQNSINNNCTTTTTNGENHSSLLD